MPNPNDLLSRQIKYKALMNDAENYWYLRFKYQKMGEYFEFSYSKMLKILLL